MSSGRGTRLVVNVVWLARASSMSSADMMQTAASAGGYRLALGLKHNVDVDRLSVPVSLFHINNMPGRTRPIEKFAEATAKCSAEV